MMGKKGWLALSSAVVLMAGASAVVQAAGKKGGPCDVATVEKAAYCEKCKMVLDKEMVDDKGECKHCKVATKEVEVCVKKGFECPGCHMWGKEAGKCEHCKKDLVEKTSMARVVYKCPKCKYHADEAGKCTAACCKDKDVALEKSCEKSGHAPHSTEK